MRVWSKLEREGDEMFRVFTENLEKARRRLSECKYIRLVTPQAVSAREFLILTDPRYCFLLWTVR